MKVFGSKLLALRGWGGGELCVKFPGKKSYITHEWPIWKVKEMVIMLLNI